MFGFEIRIRGVRNDKIEQQKTRANELGRMTPAIAEVFAVHQAVECLRKQMVWRSAVIGSRSSARILLAPHVASAHGIPKAQAKAHRTLRGVEANVALVEDTASGQSLIQELKSGTTMPVHPIKPDRDKVSRANAVTPLIECGKVFIPELAPWKDTLLDETAAFPNGQFDDICDSTTQALNYMRVPRMPNAGLVQWYEQELKAMGIDPTKMVA